VTRKLTLRELIMYGLPVLGLMVGILGYFLFVSPQQSKAKTLASQVTGAQAALLAAHQKPTKPVSAHAVELFHLTTAMPDAADVPGLLLNLTRLTQASKVTLQSITPQTAVSGGAFSIIPMTVAISGTFSAVTDFLGKLRKQVAMTNDKVSANGRLLIATQVGLSTPDGKTVSATLTVDAFYYNTTSASTTPTTTPASG
jgi:Tfp pilus assembly protein PilO